MTHEVYGPNDVVVFEVCKGHANTKKELRKLKKHLEAHFGCRVLVLQGLTLTEVVNAR